MPNATLTQRTNVIPMAVHNSGDELMKNLQASRCIPLLVLGLLVTRRARLLGPVPDGVAVLLDGWATLATELLGRMDVPAAEMQQARRVAVRAIRSNQGYESAARDKAYQVLVEYLQGAHGVDRELTDEELVALNNGMLHAFAGHAAFLDHTAGALVGGAR